MEEQPPRYSILEAIGWSKEGANVKGTSLSKYVYQHKPLKSHDASNVNFW